MLGSGIIQGLLVTAKNFAGSFHDPARYTTVEYPEVKPVLPEAFRSFPFLVCDNATEPMGSLRCVACQICEKECPPQCIYIEKSRDKKPDATGKLQIYPTVFAIDTSVCMGCQICVEVCPFDAIKMDQVFEIATTDRYAALMLDRAQLTKPNTYFHTIHPTEANEVDTRLAADRRAAEEKSRLAALAKAQPKAENGPPGPLQGGGTDREVRSPSATPVAKKDQPRESTP
jgi:NADH-quinone oxidoreductase subunit I